MDRRFNKAALYIRVSTEEQAAEGQSVDAQIETLKQYCKLYDIEIYGIYKDLGISGKDTRNRPGLKSMMQDAAQGRFHMVLVWKISRLSRSLKDLLLILDELEQRNIIFGSYSEKFDTSTPVGKMTLQLLGSIAEFERNTIIDNVKLGLKEYARKGGKTGTVLGYDNSNKQLVINPQEAKIIDMIFRLYTEDRWSLSQITDYLNQGGFKTKRGNHFTKDSISVILSNPVYIGINRHNIDSPEEYTTPGSHTPLIQKTTWDLAQSLKDKNKRCRPSKKEETAFILSGKLMCPKCKGVMYGFSSQAANKSYRYYKCKSCKHLCPASAIENSMRIFLKDLLCNDRVVRDVLHQIQSISFENTGVSTILQLEQEIEQCSRLLNKYIHLLESKDFADSNRILSRIKELEQKLTMLEQTKIAQTNKESITIPVFTPKMYTNAIEIIFLEVINSDFKQLIDLSIKSVHLSMDHSIQHIDLNFVL